MYLKPLLLKTFFVLLVLPACVCAQDDDDWPSLSYLRQDYRSVAIVAHIRIEEAEITNRVGGYENWKIRAVVIERSLRMRSAFTGNVEFSSTA